MINSTAYIQFLKENIEYLKEIGHLTIEDAAEKMALYKNFLNEETLNEKD